MKRNVSSFSSSDFVFPNEDVALPLSNPVADDVPMQQTRNLLFDVGTKLHVQLGEIRRRVRVKEIDSTEFAVETKQGDSARTIKRDRGVDFRRFVILAEQTNHCRVVKIGQIRFFVELQRGFMMNKYEWNVPFRPRY